MQIPRALGSSIDLKEEKIRKNAQTEVRMGGSETRELN